MAESAKKTMSEEMLKKVSGGAAGELADPRFEVGDSVTLKFANEEGIVTSVPGTVTERRSNPAGWEYKIRYAVNGKEYNHWYPEIAL